MNYHYETDYQWLAKAKAFNERLNSAHHIDREGGKVVALYGVPLSCMAIRDDVQFKIIPGVLGEPYQEMLQVVHNDEICRDIVHASVMCQTTLGAIQPDRRNIAIENAFDLSDQQVYMLVEQLPQGHNLLLMFKADGQRQLQKLASLERMCYAA